MAAELERLFKQYGLPTGDVNNRLSIEGDAGPGCSVTQARVVGGEDPDLKITQQLMRLYTAYPDPESPGCTLGEQLAEVVSEAKLLGGNTNNSISIGPEFCVIQAGTVNGNIRFPGVNR